MTTVTYAKDLNLNDVEERFGLTEIIEPAWFREWQTSLPDLTEVEQQRLEEIRSDFLALAKHPLHEEVVKLVMIGPLLSMAGMFRPPFLPVAEKSVEILLEGDETEETIRGRVDLLILHKQIWVTSIEAKRHSLSLIKAIPQALFYMLNAPNPENLTYGLISNGQNFLFLKLDAANRRYALSQEFSLRRPNNELCDVLQILKKLGGLAVAIAAA